jgi:proteasome-associated ATPase
MDEVLDAKDAAISEKEKRITELEAMVKNLESSLKLATSSKEGDTNMIKEAENRIHILEELLTERIDGTESGKDLVLRLKNALEVAKEKIIEQRKRIIELTQEPLILATILRLYEKKGIYNFKEAPYDAFYEGSFVRLKPGGKFKDHLGVDGEIQHITSNVAEVRFDDGHIDKYPVGPKENALLLLDEKNSTSPKRTALVHFEGRTMEVTIPEKFFSSLSPGKKVKLSQKLQVVGYSDEYFSGELATVISRLGDDHCQIDFQGTKHKIFSGDIKLEIGDVVLIDSSRTVVLQNLGKDTSKFSVETLTPVEWDDIGGLKDAKAQMMESFILPEKYAKKYAYYKKKLPKGILLIGGPGCGKTLLVRGLLSQLVKKYGEDFLKGGFILINGPEILNKYVGESEGFIREVFARARAYTRKTGNPAFVFIDEVDAIGKKRGSGKSSDVETTIVPALLAEMNGLNDSSVVVMFATNRVDILDPALIRDGRIDIKIPVYKPSKEDALEIFEIHIKGAPTIEGLNTKELAKFANEEVFSGKYSFFEFSPNESLKSKKKDKFLFGLPGILSGAMIAAIAESTKAYALRRDIETETKTGKECLTGLSKDDFLKAISNKFEENKLLNHEDDIEEFVSKNKLDPYSMTKVTT